MNFLDSLFKIIIYNEGHLRRIKKDNNIPDDIIMQSHLTEFALTIKDIVARIIQRAKDENVDIYTYIEQIESSINQITTLKNKIIKRNDIK